MQGESSPCNAKQRGGGLHENEPHIHRRIAASAARGARVTFIGVVTSAVLAAIKIVTGLVGSSYALIADGIESILDIMSSLVVMGSLRLAASPPTDRYPFGYGRAESLAALAVASVLLVAALGIAVQSVREILTPHHAPAPYTLVVLVGVIVTKEVMYRLLFRTGRDIESTALQTDAWHHRADSLTSLAAFIGISIALVAGEGYESADDWAALVACGIIAFNGVRLFRSAAREVLDAAPPPRLEDRIRATASRVEGVRGIEKCRVRKAGLALFVEIHVEVPGGMTVREGHELAHDVKDALLASDIGVVDAAVHIEPVGDESA